RILVTGANGFIGRSTCEALSTARHEVLAAVRDAAYFADVAKVASVGIGNIGAYTHWVEALNGVDVVVHLAAHAEAMPQFSRNTLDRFREINTAGTLTLARQALEAGVRRFVFVSTIKVNGEVTHGQPIRVDDSVRPVGAYAISKHEAELGLRAFGERGLDFVIIRSPLVYGPGVKGNFRTMMAWVYKGRPLPLGAVRNKRSLVALNNLVDLIITCIDHPAAVNGTFLVSDGEDLSTPELLRRMALALGKPAHLLRVPTGLIRVGAALFGKQAIAQRLCSDLQVDISHTCNTLQWAPPINVDEALKQTAEAYLIFASKK
ncbi:MAG: UDP-glucose 4-epimerase family protein, partial [Gammaproteobacteria bacterium]